MPFTAMIAALALSVAGAAAPATPATAVVDGVRADAEALRIAAKTGRCETILPLVRRVSARFDELPVVDTFRLATFTIGANCAARTNLLDEALADAREATRLPGASDDMWRLRLQLDVNLTRPEDLVETAELMVHVRPGVLQSLDLSWIYHGYSAVRSAGSADLSRRYLMALAEVRYAPKGTFDSADPLWLDLATMLADDRRTADASALLSRIRAPGTLIRARLDSRFAALVSGDPGTFDVRTAAEAQLKRDMTAAQAEPKQLVGVVAVALDLMMLGRSTEALSLVVTAETKARAAAHPGDAYSDWNSQGNWLADQQAQLLTELGRFDEALAALKRGAAGKEHGQDNVSQVINLAGALVDLRRPRETLEVLKVFGEDGAARNPSPFGRMQVILDRACAYAQSGDKNRLRAALEVLADREADDPATRTNALLCAGDLDAAAASYVQRLQSSDRRGEALVELSEFADPAAMTPWQLEMRRRALTVRARADVKAAVSLVGHTERLPIRPPPGVRAY